jgi:hypothetical protein
LLVVEVVVILQDLQRHQLVEQVVVVVDKQFQELRHLLEVGSWVLVVEEVGVQQVQHLTMVTQVLVVPVSSSSPILHKYFTNL